MRTTIIFSSLLMIFSLLTGCNDDESDFEKQVKIDAEKIENYLTDNSINAEELREGFYYQKLEENTDGESVSTNDVVSFYYTMSLLDGTELGSYMDSQKAPLKYKHGVVGLWPEGLETGIDKMHVGEHYRFYLPSYMAYYTYSNSSYFPTFSNFIIDIKIAAVTLETEVQEIEQDSIESFINEMAYENAEEYASGLFYVETLEGDGVQPLTGDYVTIHFTRKYLDGTVIESSGNDPVSFYLGSNNAVEGLQDGIRLMKEGGEAIVVMPSKIAFGKSLQVLPVGLREELYEDNILLYNVEPYSPVLYEVELIDVR